jgi:hypothetical protein
MNAPATLTPAPLVKRQQRVRVPGGAELGTDSSRDAKRLAAAILEVLAGARTPTDAATALGISVPRYYQVESRALHALLVACEPRPKGRVRNPHHEIEALRQQQERLQREVTRQQALVRAAHRSVGLAAPSAPVGKATGQSNGKKRRRRPVARALSVAARLQTTTSNSSDVADNAKDATGDV